MSSKGYGKGGRSKSPPRSSFVATVKFFNAVKGFGFILHEDGNDLFCHIHDCLGNPPQQGDLVQYELKFDERKQKHTAANVSGGTGERVDWQGAQGRAPDDDDRGGKGGYQEGGGRGQKGDRKGGKAKDVDTRGARFYPY